MKSYFCAMAAAILVLTGASTSHAAEWWRLGKTSDNRTLFIDAASFDDSAMDFMVYAIGYRGMFVYDTPYNMAGGAARYEEFEAEIDCELNELFEFRRRFYDDRRVLISAHETKETIAIQPNTAADWEADFVCESASNWSARGFTPVADPVANVRGW